MLLFVLVRYQQTHLLNGLVRLQGDIGNIGIHHERKQIQDEVGISEAMEGRRTNLLQWLNLSSNVVGTVICSEYIHQECDFFLCKVTTRIVEIFYKDEDTTYANSYFSVLVCPASDLLRWRKAV